MQIELPASVVNRHGESQVLLEVAIALFKADMFTLGQASRFSNMTQRDFQKILGERKIPLHYDEQMFEKDVETLKALFRDRHQ